MLNWEQIIVKSFCYIIIASPFVFIACYTIICILRYSKQKDEKNRKILKQYKKQTKTKHTRLTDVNSDSSTQLCSIQVENPNQPLYRLDETYPLMNSYVRDSANGSFVNDPDERHLKYSDSLLLLSEEGAFEDMSENEDLSEKLSCLQNKKNKSQDDLISFKISNSMKNIQSKGRSPQPKIIHCDNSIRKHCKCNRGDTKSLTTQKNTIKENHSITNRNFDDTCLTTDTVEGLHKKIDHKYGVHDREISIPSMKHASNKNEELETDISSQKFQHYHFDNDQEYILNSENIFPLPRTHEKCSKCTASKEDNFTPKTHETQCFPHCRCNQQEVSNYHKDLRAPLFQNSNIPIAKKVLEDDQFYDLRQKFCGAENILNASKHMTDEIRFNRLITNNKEIYHTKDKSYTVRDENYFEEENAKYPRIRYAAHFTEESRNGNQTSNASSPCDSSDKAEVMCNYWKSLKTKTASQKRNKGVQVEISSENSNDSELLLQMYTDETKGVSKRKSQETSQSKQAQAIIVKKNAESGTRNQSTQINRDKKQHIPIESSLTEIVEHNPNVQLHAAQMSDDKRHTENRIHKNCKCFLASGDYSEERIDATKPRTIHSRPRLKQAESHYPCDEHLLSNRTQLNDSTENVQYYVNGSLTPNFRKKWENVYNRNNVDYDLQNEHNYVCHPTMPVNHHENNQYWKTYNDIKRKQMQRMYLEQGNMPLSNHFVQQDKYKHRTSPVEQNICYNSEQIMKSQFPNFHKSPNKMPITTHQYVQNKSSMNDPNIPTNFWSDENKLCVRNRDIQNEDDSIQLLSHKTNNRQKKHDATETDVKEIQTSAVVLMPPNHAKEYSKQTSKNLPKKSKSQIKVDAEQAVEKSNAEQIQAKENVLKQIKRMYAHMDQNVHETNKSVTTQIKKVLKSKGMWHSEK